MRGRGPLRRALALLVAALFAASVPGRPAMAMAMAAQHAGQAAAQSMDCPGQHQMPSHGMPGAACCLNCGPTCEGCATPAVPLAAVGAPDASAPTMAVSAAHEAALPAAGSQVRQPLPVGPPPAPVA